MIGSGSFIDNLNRQRKDYVEVEKLQIQGTFFVKLIVKGIYVQFDT
jgi:hypothetical protein